VKKLTGKLWELREESRTDIYRVIYCFVTGRRVLLIHGFQKKTQRTPRGEIEIAERRLERSWRWKAVRVMVAEDAHDAIDDGAERYQRWRERLLATPERRRLYEAEASKLDLWLQMVEARQAAGLSQAELAARMGVSQAQIARLEKRGYDGYSLRSLRRYIAALGDGFRLEVSVRPVGSESIATTSR
jgi:DNA-binding XRE family transcriptional regulator